MFLRRNVASQQFTVPGSLRLIADGAAVTSGATIYLNGSSTAGGGTLTHWRSGAWRYTPTQAETDVLIVEYVLEATDALPLAGSVRTTATDPNDASTYKADVSGIAEKTDLPANFGDLDINASGHIARVTLVDTTTTNTDMRGTDGANTTTPPTASAVASQVRTELATELGRIDQPISDPVEVGSYANGQSPADLVDLSGLSTFDPTTDPVTLDLTQVGITFRDVSAVGEASVTVADCLAAAFVQAAGGESVVGTTYTRKRPAGTAFRIFTLDDDTTPTERS